MKAAAAVLAGGRGRRFGGNKPLAPWKNGTLIEASVGALRPLFTEILVCAKRPGDFSFLRGPNLVKESSRVFHPLAGLIAALEESPRPWVFLRGADMPFLAPALVRALWRARGNADAVVPLWRGRAEPLCGFYHRRILPAARRALKRQAGMQAFLSGNGARFLDGKIVRRADPRGRSFRDADTPRALAALK